MVDGGAQILQYRFKTQLTASLLDETLAIAELCQQAKIPFIVNDRADVAMLAHAGLHVGQEDLPPTAARRLIGPQATLGFSTHNADQMRAAAAEPVDYVAFGPVFATASKQRPDPTTGLDRLREIRSLTGRPLVAIGGITRTTAPGVWQAGADSVAIIGDLLPENGTLDGIRQRISEWVKLSQ
jgi:thiamine-phosphate pyrophosphorylase